MNRDPKNGNQYDSDPPDEFIPPVPPWQDSQLLQLTPEECEVQEKALAEEDECQKRDYEALEAALDDKESYGLTFEILLQAFDYVKRHPDRSIAEAIQYGFDEWVK